ncbi:MAG: site-specific integrase [Paludibacteraceae bacterium]|nr:site-specific integrase [Paludibacteraceae bacterium]
MATSFNLELNNKPTHKSTYKILLRITQNRKHKRISTSIELKSQKDYNPNAKYGYWIRASEPNHKVWNETLIQEIEKAKQTYRELKEKGLASSELIKATIKETEVYTSFLGYAKQRTKDILNEGGYRNFKKYNGFCNKLEAFLKTNKKKDLLFVELTPSMLSKFEAFLHTLRNERNQDAMLHPNTIAVNLRIFKTIINRAIEIDKLIKPEQNPFLGYKYTREVSTPKEKLNESEIKLIEDLNLEEGSLIWHCRNYFLFSFYLAGIRAGDLIQLRWCNITEDGRLEYRMAKTKKDRSIFLHDKARNILNHYYKEESKPTDYIFPLLDSNAPYSKAITSEQKATLPPDMIIKLDDTVSGKNALINKYLNKIAKQAEIEKHISMHIARHSFAKIAKDNNVDNNHLKNLLGHSNIKITETYMGNFETQETDNVMASIFKKKEDPQKELEELLKALPSEKIKTLIEQLKH